MTSSLPSASPAHSDRTVRLASPSVTATEAVQSLAESGQVQQALFVAQATQGPVAGWENAEDLAFAAEMLAWCGAPRRGEALAVKAWRREPQSLLVRRVCLELALARRDEAAVWQRGCQGAAPGPISAEAVAFLRVLGRGWWFLGEKGQAERCWSAAGVDADSSALVQAEKWLASLESGAALEASVVLQVEKKPKTHAHLTFTVANALAVLGQRKRALNLLRSASEGTEWSAFHRREAELWLIEGNAAYALAALEKYESSARMGDDRTRREAARLKILIWLSSGNPGRAGEMLAQMGVKQPAAALNYVAAQLHAFGEVPEFATLEEMQDFCSQQPWVTLADEWSLAEVAEALKKGWLVAWRDAGQGVMVPAMIDLALGAVFSRQGRIEFWGGPHAVGREQRRLLVALPPGTLVPAGLAQRSTVLQGQWLWKLRQALAAGELGRGWQFLHEVEAAGGPGPTLTEARGRMAEAAAGDYPVSTWRSEGRQRAERMDRLFQRKLKAAEQQRDVTLLQNTLLGKLRWQRQTNQPWDASAWDELLGQLLACAARAKELPQVLMRLESRWLFRGDAMSLGDVVDAHLRLGDRATCRRLLEAARPLPEVGWVVRLLESRADLLDGHVNEALGGLLQLEGMAFAEVRWVELAQEMATSLGRNELADKFAWEGLRLAPGRVAWWEMLAAKEGQVDPENGTRRIWHQALRTRNGDAPLYLAALRAARRLGPVAWEGMILDDWTALSPHHPILLLEKARTALAQRRLKDATELLEPVLQHRGTAVEATALLAQIHTAEGKPEVAAGLLLDAWRAAPNAMPLWHELLKLATKAAIRIDLLNEAGQLLHQGKAGRPLLLAWRQAVGDEPGAAQQLQAIAMARPDLAEPTVELAQSLMAAQKDTEAAELLRNRIHRHFLHPGIWRERAKLHDLVARAPSAESALFWQQTALLGKESSAWLNLASWQDSQKDAAGRQASELAANFAAGGVSSQVWETLGDRADQRGEAATSMRYLANALLRKPLDGPLWRKLLDRSQKADQPAYAEQIAEWMCQLFPNSLDTALAAARLHLHEDRGDKFKASLARAVALNPRNVDSYALEAQWHVKQKDYRRAQEACCPPALGQRLVDMPIPLRARHAWVESTRGDIETAIRLMRPVLEAAPDYEWGRQEMLGWLNATGQQREAEALLSRAGQDQRTLRKVRNEADIERLEPLGEVSTIYEKLRIFDQLLQSRKVDEAAKVLEEMRQYYPGPLVTARTVAMAVAVSDKERVQDALDRLIGTKTDDRWSLEAAVDGYEKMFGRPRLLNFLEKKSRQLDAVQHPGMLACWVRKLNENTWKGLPGRVLESIPAREDACQAVVEYLAQLAEKAKQVRMARRSLEVEAKAMELALTSLQKHLTPWLASRTDTWLGVGAAWNALGQHKKAFHWLIDHLPEPLSAEMLDQLMLAAQGTGKHKQALALATQGRELPDGKLFPRFHVWPALEAALQNDFRTTDELLGQNFPPMTEDLRTTQRLARTLSRLGQEKERPTFSESLENQFREFWIANRSLKPKRFWRRALRQLAVRCFSLRPVWWGFWNQNRKWIRAAFLVIGLTLTLIIAIQIKRPRWLPWNSPPPPRPPMQVLPMR